jgi:hypothetical protein
MAEIVSRVVAQGAVEVTKMLGKSAMEWWSAAKQRQSERTGEVCFRAGSILNLAGVAAIKKVPDSIAVPLLEAASLEDNAVLREKWAGLLASAAQEARDDIHPSFPQILRLLSARDVKFLDACAPNLDAPEHEVKEAFTWDRMFTLYCQLGITHLREAPLNMGQLNAHPVEAAEDKRAFEISLSSLCSNLLLEHHQQDLDVESYMRQAIKVNEPNSRRIRPQPPRSRRLYGITTLGVEFVRACRGPAPFDART